ncbi:uncharacterized protein LOC105204092 isoform X2 [Solenopsis invicta]|uniref:uncharacterized protein LOC105204092 isoform X2 n=1 Tax=Solenopsis invicta TaxID=13686 RepID=UPI00193D3410|nr:uncharacterized protein LOC105204092 isoform X2 [Solenopsis invicta]
MADDTYKKYRTFFKVYESPNVVIAYNHSGDQYRGILRIVELVTMSSLLLRAHCAHCSFRDRRSGSTSKMGLNSFSVNRRIFEKFFFYLFSIYIGLYGIVTTSWAKILQISVIDTDRTTTWQHDAIISLEVLIITSIVLFLIALFGFGFSILYFENSNFRKWNIILCTTVVVPSAKTDFTEAFKNYYLRTEDQRFIDNVQSTLVCCGIYSYHDYEEILHNPTIPGSCCFSSEPCTSRVVYKHGCASLLNIYGHTLAYIYSISISTLIDVVAQFLCFLVGLYLAISIRKRNNANNQAPNYQETRVTSSENNFIKIFDARS